MKLDSNKSTDTNKRRNAMKLGLVLGATLSGVSFSGCITAPEKKPDNRPLPEELATLQAKLHQGEELLVKHLYQRASATSFLLLDVRRSQELRPDTEEPLRSAYDTSHKLLRLMTNFRRTLEGSGWQPDFHKTQEFSEILTEDEKGAQIIQRAIARTNDFDSVVAAADPDWRVYLRRYQDAVIAAKPVRQELLAGIKSYNEQAKKLRFPPFESNWGLSYKRLERLSSLN